MEPHRIRVTLPTSIPHCIKVSGRLPGHRYRLGGQQRLTVLYDVSPVVLVLFWVLPSRPL